MLLEAEQGLDVVGEAGDVESAIREVADKKPSILVLDLNMPGTPTLPAIPDIVEAAPNTAIIVLTMQTDPAFAREAMRVGARGYVAKAAAGDELVEAIRTVTGGGTYINPALGAGSRRRRPVRSRC